jgi:hypothetical protein
MWALRTAMEVLCRFSACLGGRINVVDLNRRVCFSTTAFATRRREYGFIIGLGIEVGVVVVVVVVGGGGGGGGVYRPCSTWSACGVCGDVAALVIVLATAAAAATAATAATAAAAA